MRPQGDKSVSPTSADGHNGTGRQNDEGMAMNLYDDDWDVERTHGDGYSDVTGHSDA